MKTLNVIVMVMFSLQIFAQENTPKRTISSIVQREDKLILNLTSDNWGSLSPEIKSKPFRSRGFSLVIMLSMDIIRLLMFSKQEKVRNLFLIL